ncbi:23S rRNA (uracil(1939)-C(5))-methyltransferase RlmD [Sessilibacter sp. MAH1]
MARIFQPSKSNKAKLPKKTELLVEGLTNEGRGIAYFEGKTVFIRGAYLGERARVRFVRADRNVLHAETESILELSPERVEPFCQHFGQCGGCDWQYLSQDRQIELKQQLVLESLAKFARCEPSQVLPPLMQSERGYRYRAKLAAWNNASGERVLGFRESEGKSVVAIECCPVLSLGNQRSQTLLQQWLASNKIIHRIDQVDLLETKERCAVVLTLNANVDESILKRLHELLNQESHLVDVWLSRKSKITYFNPVISAEGDPDTSPSYLLSLDHLELSLDFSPPDFIQANQSLNSKMVHQAVNLLASYVPNPKIAHVLDLFCGIGNFSLALARIFGAVTGVELSDSMVEKARANAIKSGIENASFVAENLQDNQAQRAWVSIDIQGVLLDPPRSGAKEILPLIEKLKVPVLVYVSCNPVTFVRDAAYLLDHGYKLDKFGLIDMFTHTHHSEVMASFVLA